MKTRIPFLLFLLALPATNAFGQEEFYARLAAMALELTNDRVVYDPSYYRIGYPDGDVPSGRGVCTDVIIRAYRKAGIDLQVEVHEDMKAHFMDYPRIWGLASTDKNIDHRRVPNLMKFFERKGEVLKVSLLPGDYSPGDIVCWDLGHGITHIGILSSRKSSDGKRFLVVHNIGRGQVLEDVLFEYRITGHYRYSK